MIRSFLLILSVILINSSCQKEALEEPTVTQFANVDSRLAPFFVRFEQEAAARGFQINIADQELSASIEYIPEEHVAGLCMFNSASPNHITVDEGFYNSVSSITKEFIVYHELGHCVLGRGHEESQFSNGVCRSIMRSGLGSCRDNYTAQTREAYLDELFRGN